MRRTIWVGIILFAGFWLSCASHRSLQIQEEPQVTAQEPETPTVVPLNPRTIEIELRVEVSNIRVLRGAALRRDNRARGVPETAPPQLHLWSAAIVKRPGQTILDLGLEGPMPTDLFVEPENHNQIFYWDLSPLLGKQDPIVISRRVRVESYELLALIDSLSIGPYDPTEPDFRRYTREEPFIEISPQIIRTAYRIVGSETNPYRKARLIFGWVAKNMRYQRKVGRRGADEALRQLRGDSGQFADLFVALCRAVQVPARPVYGFAAGSNNQMEKHAWAEFYLPQHGWIPVDPSYGLQAFGHTDNRRIVASVGRNIPLKHAPYWATYANSEVEDGRTPFMQVVTVVKSGVRATIRSSIRTLNFDREVAGMVPVNR